MFSPPLKKSIVFLKYALKMDLVKGAWFDLYELGGVIVNNRVTEEIIKITFGDNWLIAAFVFVVAVSAIRFIRKNNLPK